MLGFYQVKVGYENISQEKWRHDCHQISFCVLTLNVWKTVFFFVKLLVQYT